MGTNYYWRDQPCAGCGRYEQLHVGKSSAGWCFLFRIYEHRLESEEHPEWGYGPESPLGFPVLSRSDWRSVFTGRPGELWDEYGRKVPDPVEWIDALAAPTAAAVQVEDDRMRSWGSKPYGRDPEGFRTETREFS